jgi:ribonuclease H
MPIIAHNPVPASCASGAPCVLGIDEAGRGPILGPMVYGTAYWAEADESDMAALGFNDSKQLTEQRRDALFARMDTCGRVGWMTHSLTAREIAAAMLRRSPVSLNALSHDAAMLMIEAVLAMGVRVEKVFVDTVGDPDYYQSKLTRLFNAGAAGGGGRGGRGWAIDFVVTKKADSLFKCVSAASIAAKVERDRSIREWVFDEPALAHIVPPARGGAAAAAVAAAAAKAKTKKAAAAAAAAASNDHDGEEEVEDEDGDNAGAGAASSSSSSSSSAAAAVSTVSKRRHAVIDDDEDDEDEGGNVEEAPAAAAAADDEHVDDDVEEADVATPAAKRVKTGASSSSSSSSSLHPAVGGSGYPSDPLTKAWVKNNLDAVFGWPSVVRFSWQPAVRALESDGAAVDWGEEDGDGVGAPPGMAAAASQPKLSSFFGGGGAAAAGAAKARCKWLRSRHIEPVAAM